MPYDGVTSASGKMQTVVRSPGSQLVKCSEYPISHHIRLKKDNKAPVIANTRPSQQAIFQLWFILTERKVPPPM